MPTPAAATADSSVPDTQQLAALVQAQASEIAQLRAQVAWFQRQLFGSKSEKRLIEPDAAQGTLGEAFDAVPDTPAPGQKTRVAGHDRTATRKRPAGDESTLFFDENKVPVEVIHIPNTEAEGLDPEDVEVIGERVSHRLAQRPGSYVILKYVRPVIKRRDTQQLSCPAAPAGVLEGSRADVSFIAGLLVDKLCYHLPLYRQHQRLGAAGVKVSRPWLTQVAQSAVALLEPVFDAQWQSILTSRVKTMDETPIKAGRDGPGKMKSAYFWPVMGQADEICFHYQPSRRQTHVQQMLGQTVPAGGVLHTDGYSAYAWYAKKTGIAHAQCWAHSRRGFIKAEGVEPDRVATRWRISACCTASSRRSGTRSCAGKTSAPGGSSMRSRPRWRSSLGSRNSSRDKDSCRAARSPRRWRTCANARRGCCCTWTIRRWKSTPTRWNGRCAPFRWAKRTGCSAGPSSAPNRSAWRKACW